MADLVCPVPNVAGSSSPAFTNGYIAYNDVILNLTTKSRCSVRPVYSESGRQIQWLQYTLQVDAVLVADACNPTVTNPIDLPPGYRQLHQSTTGASMAELRERLLQPGKTLDLKCIGLGYDLRVSEASATIAYDRGDRWSRSVNVLVPGNRTMTDPAGMYRVDVLYGPRPQSLNWEPLGHSRACRINWVVEFRLARCYDEKTDIAAMEWETGWALNEAGLTTRSTTGYLQSANAMLNKEVGDRHPANFADRYRDWIPEWFPRLDGYHRTHEITQSADRSRLNFTIVDAEIDSGENAYYPGVVRANVSRAITNGSIIPAVTASTWTMTLSGTIEVAKDQKKALAWAAFITIVREQLSYFTAQADLFEGVDEDDQKKNVRQKAKFTMLTGLSISEELFGRSVQFSISWSLVTSLKNLIESVGMFEPLDAKAKQPMEGAQGPEKIHDWSRWSESMKATQSPRGHQKLAFKPADDIVADFCRGDVRLGTTPQETVTPLRTQEPLFSQDPPDPEFSYLGYYNVIQYEEDTGTVRMDVIKEPSFEPHEFDDEARGAFRKDEGVIKFTDQAYSGGDTEPSVITHRRGDSAYAVTLYGYAVRAGYRPQIPTLDSHGATLESRRVTITPIGRTSTVIYLAQWMKTYILEEALTGDIGAAGSMADPSAPKLIGQGLAEGIT